MVPQAPRVAVVDDDASVRRALKRVLRVDGLQAEEYPSAQAFLDASGQGTFDCLVLDVHLGGMSGLDLLAHLVAEGGAVPVVIITAHDDAPTREKACALGASAYLRKPLESSVLLDAVHTALSRQPLGALRRGAPR